MEIMNTTLRVEIVGMVKENLEIISQNLGGETGEAFRNTAIRHFWEREAEDVNLHALSLDLDRIESKALGDFSGKFFNTTKMLLRVAALCENCNWSV